MDSVVRTLCNKNSEDVHSFNIKQANKTKEEEVLAPYSRCSVYRFLN